MDKLEVVCNTCWVSVRVLHSAGPNLQFLLAAVAVTVPSAAAVRVSDMGRTGN